MLRRFAGPDGRIWQHDKERRFGPDRRRPEDVGGETHLYAPIVAGQRLTDEVEQWLASQIDGPIGTPLDLIEQASEEFAAVHREAVARFLAALDMRTPHSRDWLQPAFEAALRDSINDFKAAQRGLFWEHGRVVPLEEIQALAAEEGERLLSEQLPTSWLDYIKRTLPLASKRVARGAWSLVYAPAEAEFVTSDLAIAKLSGLASFVPHQFGFVGDITHWAVPLSPRHALLVAAEPGEQHVFEAEAAWVRALNAQIAEDTPRFVYARSRMAPEELFPPAS